MKIIDQSHEIMEITPNILQLIEKAGRTCYKSENKITDDSASDFVKRIVKSMHHSVIEHGNTTVKFITDRGIMAELTRHRLASYSIESSRYCNYSKKLFDGITFIKPYWLPNLPTGLYHFNNHGTLVNNRPVDLVGENYNHIMFLKSVENRYNAIINKGYAAQAARSVLPNDTKTEIIMTCNVRELRHILKLRTSKQAHPQIVALFNPLKKELQEKYHVLFSGI
jgi:thymidylate synthase (FAD)